MKNCSIDDFKFALDKFLSKIPDEPNVAGEQYTPRACNQNTGRPSKQTSCDSSPWQYQYQKRIKMKIGQQPLFYLQNTD